jgi:stage II sporulation protein D
VNPYNLIDLGGGVYRGGMHVIGDAEGQILAVNVLSVDDYLRGVLPYELGNIDREGLEALKAQAIVARTYAYKRMLHAAANADFHLYSDVQDQVYKGVRGEYLMSDRAVWETRGMAVVHADTLALCYYFSTCGGRTASKHEVWGGDSIPYLVSRPDSDAMGDPFCQASKYMAWTQEWNQQQLTGILKRNLKSAGVPDFPSFSGIAGMAVTQRASCGRARALTIQTERGVITVKGDKTRWALRQAGAEDKILPSAWFTIKAAGGKFTAQGKGFGHGVGLCQMGAIARAKANQTFVQIIRAYYQGVDVVEFR